MKEEKKTDGKSENKFQKAEFIFKMKKSSLSRQRATK